MNFNFQPKQILTVTYSTKPHLKRVIDVKTVCDDHIFALDNGTLKRFKKNCIVVFSCVQDIYNSISDEEAAGAVEQVEREQKRRCTRALFR